MKNFLKLKRSKNSKFTKRNKKKRIMKKYFLDIYSPPNTSDFLINNNSSPFYSSDEDEEATIIKPSSPLNFLDDSNSKLNLCSDEEHREKESTEEKTKISLANSVQIFLIQR